MNDVLILGAARSGLAAANFLARRGVRVVLNDARQESDLPLESLDPSVSRLFGSHPLSALEGIDTVVVSPGVPGDIRLLVEAASRGIPVISEIELAFRNLQGTVIAVTGTNGKSTTTALIGEIFRVAGRDPVVAGNIGEPLIAAVDSKPRNYVVELSSFQLETVDTFRADVALLLNITPDHLDRYAGFDAYAAAKERIFRNQTPSDSAVVNAGDARTANPPTKARVLRFSSSGPVPDGAWLDGDELHLRVEGEEAVIARSSLAIPGAANVENALAAWLTAHVSGIGAEAVEKAFSSFAGLPHRMVLVRELDGVRYLNDSKGTNVDATLKSLEGLESGTVLLILGGKDKAGEFERLRTLATLKARMIITIGAAAARIEQALGAATEIVNRGDLQRAVQFARERARSGDTVLLSPACASFDQYRNFEERGRHFEQIVGELK